MGQGQEPQGVRGRRAAGDVERERHVRRSRTATSPTGTRVCTRGAARGGTPASPRRAPASTTTTGCCRSTQLPHSVDPKVGYLANWNNKPAQGWADDYLDPASSRSAGKAVRVQTIQRLLAAEPQLTPARLRTLEYELGTTRPADARVLPAGEERHRPDRCAAAGARPGEGLERPQLRTRRGHQLHLVRRRDGDRRAGADDLPAPDGRPAGRGAARPAARRWWSRPTTAVATSSTAPRRTTWCCGSCGPPRAR